MHGGYFSLALCKYGLTGISHGVGYGEQKDVVPVIGQATPTVRYYLPDVHKRFGVPDIQRGFDALDIRTPLDFHRKVCGCVICKGVVSSHCASFLPSEKCTTLRACPRGKPKPHRQLNAPVSTSFNPNPRT